MAIERNAALIDFRGVSLTMQQQRRVNLALREIGQNVKRQMRRRVRIRTGRLRSSIFTRGGHLRQVVGFNEGIAHYAKYVEFGTRYFPGDHIMERSIAAEARRSPQLITRAIFGGR